MSLLPVRAPAAAGDPPGFYPEANSKGAQLAKARNFKEALAELTLEIAAQPSGNAYYWRAACWEYNDEAAIADYAKAIELAPHQAASAHLLRGMILWRLQRNEAALADFAQCIELEPKAAIAYSWRARILSDLDKPVAAAADLTKAITLDPTNADFYLARGREERQAGETDKALADYAKASALGPKNPGPHFLRAFILEDRGEWTAATAEVSHAAAAAPDQSDAQVAVARFMLRKGDVKSAMLAFDLAIVLDPKAQFAHYFRGCSRYDLGELDSALDDFRQICEGDPGDWCDYAQCRIWLIRARVGDKVAATEQLSKYLGGRTVVRPDDSSGKLLRFLAGQLPESDFIKGVDDTYAASLKQKADRIPLCEAYFYAGSRRLVTGDKEGAKARLVKCRSLDLKDSSDYASAVAELKNLQAQK